MLTLRIENIQCDARAHAAVRIHRQDVPAGEPQSLIAEIAVPAGEVVRVDVHAGAVVTVHEEFRHG